MAKMRVYSDEEISWYLQDRVRIEGLLKERDKLRCLIDKIEQRVNEVSL